MLHYIEQLEGETYPEVGVLDGVWALLSESLSFENLSKFPVELFLSRVLLRKLGTQSVELCA